ncbi:dermonecrotic toxin domain-containing protein [Pseudomonas sp. NPDC087817]|uniref:dermonecrotic toxin domain-containing protein n=1 Tax=Pseudomonas sp. NPDC087817 TaxID=3364451 RepID=UPI00380854BD
MEVRSLDNAGFGKVGEALVALKGPLNDMPAFDVVLRACLQRAVGEFFQQADARIININVRGKVKPKQMEPVGSLLQVLTDCLQRGRAPKYDAQYYAIYSDPITTNSRDLLPAVPLASVEKLLERLFLNLPDYYVAVLQEYWAGKGESKGRFAVPRKLTMSELQAYLFLDELEVFSDEGGISRDELQRIRYMLQPGSRGTWYGVFIGSRGDAYNVQHSMFAIPLAEAIRDELIPRADTAIVLYSPTHGVERFSSSAEMHRTLEQRLSSGDSREVFLQSLAIKERENFPVVPEFRYLKVEGDLFARISDNAIEKSCSEVVKLLAQFTDSDSNYDAVVASVTSAQALPDMLGQAKSRQAALVRLAQKNRWPIWLQNAGSTNQEIYEALEKRLLESEVQYHEVTKGFASLKDFAKKEVEDFISPGKDVRIDPDNVFVNVRHVLNVTNGQKIETRERKTLTQAFMYGVHDQQGQFEIAVENQPYNPKWTASELPKSIKALNVRVRYNDQRQAVYSKPEVSQALRQVQGRRTALSLFSAVLQKQVSHDANDMVNRYNYDDLSIMSGGIKLGAKYHAFKELRYFKRKLDQDSPIVVYAPGFPGSQEWFEFATFKALRNTLLKWVQDDEVWEYLKSQAVLSDVNRMVAEVTGDSWTPRWIGQSSFEFPFTTEDYPLENAVKNILSWESKQIEAYTPQWFRNASAEEQGLSVRLHTEFKAIQNVTKDDLKIVPFKEFARELVMKAFAQYWERKGLKVPVFDPNDVMVKIHNVPEMPLTDLFIQWQIWRSDVTIFEKIVSVVVPGISIAIHELRDYLRTARFSGRGVVTALNAQVINDLIDLKPGERYDEYLKNQFLSTPRRALKEVCYRELKQNEMLTAALAQKIRRTISNEDFSWLKALIDDLDSDIRGTHRYPGGTADGPVEGVCHFTLNYRKVHGAYVFSRKFNGRLQSVVYVPGTHDGNDFFPVEQLSTRLKDSAFSGHVLRMVSLQDQKAVKKLTDNYKDGGPHAQPPTLYGAYKVGNEFKDEYEAMIARFRADVDYQTTSTWEAVWVDAKILLNIALDVVSLFVPPVGAVVTVLRIAYTVVEGISASLDGDKEAANAYFASAWRAAIMFYIGYIAGVGNSSSAAGLLSRINDYANLLSSVTGVRVGISYVTAVAVPPHRVESTTRLIG